MNYETDIKMELFCNREIWERTIQHGVDKFLDKAMLRKLCDPEFRAKYISAIEQRKYMVYYPSVRLVDKKTGEFLTSPSQMKQGHEYRKVYMNLPLDRVTLTLCNDVYNKLYGKLIHKNCVSYQRGIGVSNIIKELSKKMQSYKLNPKDIMGYKIDISKYFDSVDKTTLFQALDELDTNSPIDELIRDYYSCDTVIDEYGNQIEHYKSLAQGCALGSFLSNYVLRNVDAELSSMDIIYYRYSDDIIMLGKDCHKAYVKLVSMLDSKGLKVNPKKVQPLYYDEGFVFLGYLLKGNEIDLSPSRIEKLKDSIRDITKVNVGQDKKKISNLKRGIKKVNQYLYAMGSKADYGWADEVFKTITVMDTVVMLDRFTKDHLRHIYTHRWNFTHNQNQVPNQTLLDNGYVSMVHMYKSRQCSKGLYDSEIQKWLVKAG